MRVVLQNDNFLDTVCLPLPSLFLSLSLFSLLDFFFVFLSPDILSMQTRTRRRATDDGQLSTWKLAFTPQWALLLLG